VASLAVTACMRSAGIASFSVAPAPISDASWSPAETPLANVTTYGRDGAGVASGVGLGVASGVASGVGLGVASGVASGVGLGVASGVASGVGLGVALGVASGVGLGVALGVTSGVALGIALGVTSGVGLGVALGVTSGVGLGVATGVVPRVASGVGLGVSALLAPVAAGGSVGDPPTTVSGANVQVTTKKTFTTPANTDRDGDRRMAEAGKLIPHCATLA